MKQLFLFLFSLFFLYSEIFSQELFNRFYSRDSGYYHFNSHVIKNDKIYVLAQFNDDRVREIYASTAIITFDMKGNIIQVDTIMPRGKDVLLFFSTSIRYVNDSTLFFISADTSQTYAVYYNLNSHDLIYSKIKPHPLSKDKFFYSYPYGLELGYKNFIFVTNEWLGRLRKVGMGNYKTGDLVLTKLCNDSLVKNIIISAGDFDLYKDGIFLNKNNNIYIYGLLSDDAVNEQEDYTYRQMIMEFDTSLNIIRKIFSPDDLKLGNIYKIIEGQNGDLFCASSKLTLKRFPFGTNVEQGHRAISKYNSNGDYLWSKVFTYPVGFSPNTFEGICFNKDSTSVVAVGSLCEAIRVDSVIVNIPCKGVIANISLNGDSLWQRLYSVRGKDSESWEEFFDIKNSPDGGYLVSGSSRSDESNDPYAYQSGWLMKIDEHGCYIPGCHLVNVVNSPIEFEVKIYPNPSTDYFTILHGFHLPLDLGVYNLNGTLMCRYHELNSLETCFIPTENFAKGIYNIVLSRNGKILKFANLQKF